jgi:hypothetical protein
MTNDLVKILGLLHDTLSPVSKNWMLIGSASLYLHGLPVNPQDIDVLCDTATAIKFEARLSSYRIETNITSGKDKFRSHFSQYIINGIPVEVMGDLLVNTPTGWVNLWKMITQPQAILLGKNYFFVPNLTDQLKIYTLFGRDKDQHILTMLNR